MCDYSLHHVATRPAQIEDKLVTTKFSNSITRGFAAVGEPHISVPGSRQTATTPDRVVVADTGNYYPRQRDGRGHRAAVVRIAKQFFWREALALLDGSLDARGADPTGATPAPTLVSALTT